MVLPVQPYDSLVNSSPFGLVCLRHCYFSQMLQLCTVGRASRPGQATAAHAAALDAHVYNCDVTALLRSLFFPSLNVGVCRLCPTFRGPVFLQSRVMSASRKFVGLNLWCTGSLSSFLIVPSAKEVWWTHPIWPAGISLGHGIHEHRENWRSRYFVNSC